MADRRRDSKRHVLREGEYERPGGGYQYKWRAHGKRHSISARTLDELRREEEQIQREMSLGIRRDDITVDEYHDKWAAGKDRVRDSSLAGYEKLYRLHIKDRFGSWKVRDVKHSDVRAYAAELRANCSYNYTKSIISVLKQIMELAVLDNVIPGNPCAKALADISDETEEKHGLTEQQQVDLETYLAGDNRFHHWYPLVMVLLYTGIRIGEAAALQKADIDLKAGFIVISKTIYKINEGKGTTRYVLHKTKTDAGIRRIPITDQIRPILEALLLQRRPQQGICGLHDYVFVTRYGLPQYASNVNTALSRIVRAYNKTTKAGRELPHISCHILRHTCATRLIEAGIHAKAAQAILGHAEVSTTLDIYVDASDDYTSAQIVDFARYMSDRDKRLAVKQQETETG